ncbi:hypothetical protein LSM04_000068 [Trypanosoma melophagium]|uniref:uncharacterized protein n=1 Tax=Trypanosoma melophagium TaxID=715481 RepID=UPI00351A7864|nr:hypothetical protein LSM04_000068 [Trypanosoma melophagium]
MTAASALSGKRNHGKKYPPPDYSKSYTSVPRHQVPHKSYVRCLVSKLKVELGLNLMEPLERAVTIFIYILILVLLVGLPGYFIYRLM